MTFQRSFTNVSCCRSLSSLDLGDSVNCGFLGLRVCERAAVIIFSFSGWWCLWHATMRVNFFGSRKYYARVHLPKILCSLNFEL